jgi:hypothetical protein
MEHPARKSGGERVNTQPINDERLSDPLHIRSRLMAHAALYPDAIFQLKPEDRDAAVAAIERLDGLRRSCDAALEAVGGRVEKLEAALVAVRAERDRARMLVEHLFQMVPEQAWRDSGVYEQGVYEGEYRAMILEREIKGWAAVSSPGEEPNA